MSNTQPENSQSLSERLRLAATIIEHGLPWQSPGPTGWQCFPKDNNLLLMQVRDGKDIRVTPLELPSWSKGFHNPDGLLDAGGPEWRFCLLEELDGRYAGTAEIFFGGKWRLTATRDGNVTVDLASGRNCRCTYRVLRSVAFPDPPLPSAVDPEPVQYVDLEPLDCPPGTAFRAPEQGEGEWLSPYVVSTKCIQGKFWEESWASLHVNGWFYLPFGQKEWLPCRKAKPSNTDKP